MPVISQHIDTVEGNFESVVTSKLREGYKLDSITPIKWEVRGLATSSVHTVVQATRCILVFSKES